MRTIQHRSMRLPGRKIWVISSAVLTGIVTLSSWSTWADIAQEPLTVTRAVRPIVMLALSNDEQLYKKAYDDFTDIDNDGALETGYDNNYDYYGYFGPDLCYDYSESGYFTPTGEASNHQCSGNWSGNFLNWATMTRMDLLRRVLYGGYRSVDTQSQTILERAMIPPDFHAFAKVFPEAYPADYDDESLRGEPIYDVNAFTPFDKSFIALCNVTGAASGESQTLNTATPGNEPLIRVADASTLTWRLWSTGEASRIQLPCAWESDNASQNVLPNRTTHGLGNKDYIARVETCVSALEEGNCARYPAEASVKKPTGIIQEFGDEKAVRFGMVSGSYGKSVSGGVLRRTAGFTAGNESDNEDLDEIDLDDGTFTGNPGIIATINAFRINKYDFAKHHYTDNCSYPGLAGFENGACTNWGNPMAEIVLESLRYLAGKGEATSVFDVDDSGVNSDLAPVTWDDPITSNEWCTKCNILAVTGGVNSFDRDDLANDLSGLTIITETNAVGTAEGIGGNYILGGNATEDDGNCVIRSISDLSDAKGVCPTGGKLQGGWDVAGIAYYAHVNDFRSDRENDQFVATRAIDMGDGSPMLVGIMNGAQTIAGGASLLPICMTNENKDAEVPKIRDLVDDAGNLVSSRDTLANGWGQCVLWGVLPMNLVYQNGFLVEGDLYAFWEDTPAGGDSELDAISRVHFCVGEGPCAIEGDPAVDRYTLGWENDDGGGNYTLPENVAQAGEIRVTSSVVQVYSDRAMSFGFIIDGLFRDGQPQDTADHCDNGLGNGDGIYLDEAIPGTDLSADPDPCDKKNAKACKKDTTVVTGSYSIVTPDLGIQDENADREQRFCGRRFKPGAEGPKSAPMLKPPLWYAAKYGGFVDSNDVGVSAPLPDVDAEWDTDGDGDPDGYHMLYAPQNISESFSSIFELIAGVSSSSSVVANTFELRSGTYIYQGRFDSSDWSGDLIAFPIDVADGSLGNAAWSARDTVNQQFDGAAWDTRRVVLTSTRALGGGTPFRWSELGLTNDGLEFQTQLNRSPGPGDTDTLVDDAAGAGDGENRLNFIRGERDFELQNGGGFRDRTYLLGDIVNSDPIYVGRPPFNYPKTMGHSDYEDFADCVDPDRVVVDGDTSCGSLSPRAEMLYVGANDGMLHGFDVSSGEEKFAYVPRGVYERLPYLPYLDYGSNHRFFVDGSVITADIVESTNSASGWADTDWHTVLVGSLGAGGRGVFALDITDPRDFSEVTTFTQASDSTANTARRGGGWVPVFWDFTAADTGFADLGYTFSAPTIVQTRENYWVAAFGNGYGSDDGTATLYFLKISGYHNGTFNGDRSDSEESDHAITAHGGPNNGLSSVAPVDMDGDMVIDYVYAGDLQGNLWRFERESGSDSWTVRRRPIFVATDENEKPQPITIRPAVYAYKGGLFVVFGTGKYFETSDAAADTTSVHSLYGVWDRLDGTDTIQRADLMPQSFIAGGQVQGYDVRVSSDKKPSLLTSLRTVAGLPEEGDGTYLGWYLDLKNPGADGGLSTEGEMVAAELRTRGERVIFTTMIPSDEPCDFGGEGWLVELNYLTGAPPSGVLFDLDGDGDFDVGDKLPGTGSDGGNLAPNAKKSKIGIIQQPAIIGGGADGQEYKYASGGMPADVEVTTENPGNADGGRVSWKERK